MQTEEGRDRIARATQRRNAQTAQAPSGQGGEASNASPPAAAGASNASPPAPELDLETEDEVRELSPNEIPEFEDRMHSLGIARGSWQWQQLWREQLRIRAELRTPDEAYNLRMIRERRRSAPTTTSSFTAPSAPTGSTTSTSRAAQPSDEDASPAKRARREDPEPRERPELKRMASREESDDEAPSKKIQTSRVS